VTRHTEELHLGRDATDPDDLDSDDLDAEVEPGSEALAGVEEQLIADAAFEPEDMLEDDGVPFSRAEGDENSAALRDFLSGEPQPTVVDLRHDTIRSASLFDQPLLDDEEPSDSQLELPIELNTRQPRVETDDPSDIDEARQREIKRLLDERVRKRLELERRRNAR
jgi:hypothetical protein